MAHPAEMPGGGIRRSVTTKGQAVLVVQSGVHDNAAQCVASTCMMGDDAPTSASTEAPSLAAGWTSCSLGNVVDHKTVRTSANWCGCHAGTAADDTQNCTTAHMKSGIEDTEEPLCVNELV